MSVGHRDHGVVIMRPLILAVSIAFISGCTTLPLGGKGLEAALEGRRQEQPPAEVEPVSCQCNVYCGT